jgi:tRNA uridine 5-carboxymethylaminomethyl modification enzyme
MELEQVSGEQIGRETPLLSFLKRPGVSLAGLSGVLARRLAVEMVPDVLEQLEIETKYEGYIRRQEEELEKIRRHESIALPGSIAYDQVSGLSLELVEKLRAVRPATLARASRIPGMTPAALSLLLVHARKLQGEARAAE